MPFPNHPQERTRLADSGMRAVVRLSELWELTPLEQATLLGASSPEQCAAWLNGDVGDAGEELLYRLSYMLGLSSDWQNGKEVQRAADIVRTNRAMQNATNMRYSVEIPRSFAEWRYPHKDQPLCPGSSVH